MIENNAPCHPKPKVFRLSGIEFFVSTVDKNQLCQKSSTPRAMEAWGESVCDGEDSACNLPLSSSDAEQLKFRKQDNSAEELGEHFS